MLNPYFHEFGAADLIGRFWNQCAKRWQKAQSENLNRWQRLLGKNPDALRDECFWIARRAGMRNSDGNNAHLYGTEFGPYLDDSLIPVTDQSLYYDGRGGAIFQRPTCVTDKGYCSQFFMYCWGFKQRTIEDVYKDVAKQLGMAWGGVVYGGLSGAAPPGAVQQVANKLKELSGKLKDLSEMASKGSDAFQAGTYSAFANKDPNTEWALMTQRAMGFGLARLTYAIRGWNPSDPPITIEGIAESPGPTVQVVRMDVWDSWFTATDSKTAGIKFIGDVLWPDSATIYQQPNVTKATQLLNNSNASAILQLVDKKHMFNFDGRSIKWYIKKLDPRDNRLPRDCVGRINLTTSTSDPADE